MLDFLVNSLLQRKERLSPEEKLAEFQREVDASDHISRTYGVRAAERFLGVTTYAEGYRSSGFPEAGRAHFWQRHLPFYQLWRSSHSSYHYSRK